VRNEVSGENALAPVPDPAAGPHRRTRAAEIAEAIASALRRLGETDRTVILLREVQGLPYGEIARVLDQPLGTVKARLHRARDRMRRELLGAGVRP
jgi:RNA polymerase sigma-70 factor (ECF subfamily)